MPSLFIFKESKLSIAEAAPIYSKRRLWVVFNDKSEILIKYLTYALKLAKNAFEQLL